jgi:hypothetical protein
MLRLYQLKQWLAWNAGDTLTFKDAAAQFTALALTRRTRVLRSKRPNSSPSELLMKAISEQRYARLFDLSLSSDFRRGKFLYGLSFDHNLASVCDIVDEDRDVITSLNYFTHLQARVNLTSSLKSTQDNALDAYEYT